MRTPSEQLRLHRIRRTLRKERLRQINCSNANGSRTGKRGALLRRTGTILLACGAVAVGALAVGLAVLVLMSQPYRSLPGHLPATDTQAGNPYPEINWNQWQEENPQVIGWITIPQTDIDLPIAKGIPEDPEFYLGHDLYGNLNCYGSLYVDPDCSQAFSSLNCIVYGHNMAWDNAMFGPLEAYAESTFAWQHRTVLLQTPEERLEYEVCAVQVVNAQEALKRTSFTDEHDFARWWKRTYESCSVKLFDQTPEAMHVLTLCTCSYHSVDNERTLVYAVPRENKKGRMP